MKKITEKDLDGLIERVEEALEHGLALAEEDLRLLLSALLNLSKLQEDLSLSREKLQKFTTLASQSEKLQGKGKKLSKEESKPEEQAVAIREEHFHQLEGLSKGSSCPDCGLGKLHKHEPSQMVRISGQSPLVADNHILERLRCNACQKTFKADLPEKVKEDGEQKYGYSAVALMAIHRYFAGLPFYRQQSLQNLFGVPVSASTVFDQVNKLAEVIEPVFSALKTEAANADHFHLDDTANRILKAKAIEKPDRRSKKMRKRTGVYSSGLIATLKNQEQIFLYKTDIGHAGEWFDEILSERNANAPPPILMADALSRNLPSVIDNYHLTLCNAHARREFFGLVNHFFDQSIWVLERYQKIWENDDYCYDHNLNSEQRRDYHQEKSLPIMTEIRDYCQQQLADSLVEENSALGKAFKYFIKHFEALTGFCRIVGAEIDNNLMEANLKQIIRGRKNSLFYQTQRGADVADIITSVIVTCHHYGVNVFDYLITLQKNQKQLIENPDQWLPWNFRKQLNA